MVGSSCVYNGLGLSVLLQNVCPDYCVGALYLVGHGLSDVVEQPCPFGKLNVCPNLGGYHSGKVCNLLNVLEDVLAVAGSELEPSEEFLQLRVDVVYSKLKENLLGSAQHLLFNLLLNLLYNLFNPCRVDAAVGN